MSYGTGANQTFTRSAPDVIEATVIDGKTIANNDLCVVRLADGRVQAYEVNLGVGYEFIGVAVGGSATGDSAGTQKMRIDISGGLYTSYQESAAITAADVNKLVVATGAVNLQVGADGPVVGYVAPDLSVCIFPYTVLGALAGIDRKGVEVQLLDAHANTIVAADDFFFRLKERAVLVQGWAVPCRAFDASAAIELAFSCDGDALHASHIALSDADAVATYKTVAFATHTVREAGDVVKVTVGGTVHTAGRFQCGFVYRTDLFGCEA